MRKYKYKFLLLISVMTVLLPITVNAEELTYGQVLDDLAKAQAELRKNNQAIQNNENKIDEAQALQFKINDCIFALLSCKSLYGAAKKVMSIRFGIAWLPTIIFLIAVLFNVF